MTDPTADFDGCARECRKAGAHTLRWGGCEHATPPEPTVSMSKVFRDTDGCNSIGFDTYTVTQLAEVIEPALRSINIRIGLNALAMLERGEEVRLSVGEYASMALAAADAIVHRNDAAPAAAGVAPAADQTGLRDRIADVLARHYDGQLLAELREEHAAHHTEAADAVLAAVEEHLEIGEEQAWCKRCRRVWESRMHQCEPDQQAAIRAAALREAADRLAELRAAEREWLPATGLHKGEQELRRMAAGVQQQGDTETRAVPLAASCAYCGHRYDEHNCFGCCVGNEEIRCGCDSFTLGEKPAPVDPRTILGIDAPAAEQPAAGEEERQA